MKKLKTNSKKLQFTSHETALLVDSLKNKFYIPEYKHEDKLVVFHLTERGSRMVHKFLCLIEKKGSGFCVPGYDETTSVEVLEKQISHKVASYTYDSEYYYPGYRAGVFECHVMMDYLDSIGFKHENNDTYVLSDKNIYNYVSQEIAISIIGLDYHGGYFGMGLNEDGSLKEEVSIILHTGKYSWVETKAKREVEAMKKAVDSLLKPLFVSDSAYNFQKSTELKHSDLTDIEIAIKRVGTNLTVYSAEYRQELKSRLLEMASQI